MDLQLTAVFRKVPESYIAFVAVGGEVIKEPM